MGFPNGEWGKNLEYPVVVDSAAGLKCHTALPINFWESFLIGIFIFIFIFILPSETDKERHSFGVKRLIVPTQNRARERIIRSCGSFINKESISDDRRENISICARHLIYRMINFKS